MKPISILSIAVCGACANSLSAASLAEYVGSDVEILLSARSLAESYAEWESNPVAEIYNDESVQKFIAALDADESEDDEAASDEFLAVMEDEFGLNLDDFFELFPGQFAMGFYNLADDILSEDELTEVVADGVLLAEFSGDADRMNELMQIQFERNSKAQKEVNPAVEHVMIEETFMGETLYMDETFDGEETYIEDGYALVDGIFVIATEERLRLTVELIKESGDSIAKTVAYQRVIEQSGRGDLRVYCNLSAFFAPLNERMLEEVMKGGLAMFGVTSQSIDAALSLESMQGMFAEFDLVDDGMLMHGGIIYSEKSGLLRLLTYTDEDLPTATYVSESVLTTSISSFDFSEMLAELEKILALASPSVPMLLNIQLQQIKTNTGVDLRASILENFSGDVVSLSVMKEASRDAAIPLAEQMYVMEIKDGQALSEAMGALQDLVPGLRDIIETQEYEGETIHIIKGQSDPLLPDATVNDVSYVITRSEFILNVGRIGLLQEVLTRMVNADSGFWQLESTEQLFESIAQPNPVTRSYFDLEQMVKPMLESILFASSMGGVGLGIDPSTIPSDLDVPLVLVSESNEASEGLFMRALIMKREVAE